MDPKSKAEEQKQDDADYDKAFEDIAAGTPPAKPEEKPAEKQEPKPEEKPEPELAPKAEAAAEEEEEPKGEEPKGNAQPPADQKGLEKALKDTKSWATKVTQENAELKKKLLEFESGRATGKDVQDAKDALAASQGELGKVAEKIYADYPELKDLLDPLLKMTAEASSEIKGLKKTSDEEKKRTELRTHFEKNVEPEIVKVHPDFTAIKTDDNYFAWAEKQRPALRYAAMYSLDPQDIIEAVTEYKKFKASPEAGAKKAEDDKRKQALKDNLGSIRGNGSDSGSRQGPKKGDENDYDSAFEEAAAKLARK